MVKHELSIEEIIRNIRNKQYAPIYYLMGDEPYYIDKIADYIADTILTEEEKTFDQVILYGGENDIDSIITAAKRFPMMSRHQIIIIKEAQNLKNIDKLSYYTQKIQPTTILVFCHKNGSIDRRKKVTLEIEKAGGIIFESKRLKDAQLPPFIIQYLKRKDINIEPKACELLAEYVGANLCRLSSELDKLILSLQKGNNYITTDQIEKSTGISKDYNNFELKNALAEKDVLKANRIISYFEQNPKNNPLPVTLSIIFNFFSNLMLAYYAQPRNETGIATQLNLKNQWQAKEYISAMKKYSGVKVMQIIADIRICDVKSKGINNPSVSNGELLKELIYKILH